MAVAATLYQEVDKKPFGFSHCWIILNGKPKWNQVVADLKSSKKRNDGSNSHQSIELDDEEGDVIVTNGRATVPKDNQQVMGNKWENARASRDAAATKMSSTWTGIFSVKENNKEERYKLMLDAQKKRTEKKVEIEREKIGLEKQEAAIKWELEKAKAFGEIELEKERMQLAWDAGMQRSCWRTKPSWMSMQRSGLRTRRRSPTVGSTRQGGSGSCSPHAGEVGSANAGGVGRAGRIPLGAGARPVIQIHPPHSDIDFILVCPIC